uniref:Probable serine/threonine-protein kinase abkC n=1 Tax=Tanacetum cinerariifolium TaxID=118510 RepID=A0A699IBZ3_TANCI|nr:probable serine/threonine-protein kinase abkC [Tanacetum cinerariifolium]
MPHDAQTAWKAVARSNAYRDKASYPLSRISQAFRLAAAWSYVVIRGICSLVCGNKAQAQTGGQNSLYMPAEVRQAFVISAVCKFISVLDRRKMTEVFGLPRIEAVRIDLSSVTHIDLQEPVSGIETSKHQVTSNGHIGYSGHYSSANHIATNVSENMSGTVVGNRGVAVQCISSTRECTHSLGFGSLHMTARQSSFVNSDRHGPVTKDVSKVTVAQPSDQNSAGHMDLRAQQSNGGLSKRGTISARNVSVITLSTNIDEVIAKFARLTPQERAKRCLFDVYILGVNKRFIRRLKTKKQSITRLKKVVMVCCN